MGLGIQGGGSGTDIRLRTGYAIQDLTGESYPLTLNLGSVLNSVSQGKPVHVLVGTPAAEDGDTLTITFGDASVGCEVHLLLTSLFVEGPLPAVAFADATKFGTNLSTMSPPEPVDGFAVLGLRALPTGFSAVGGSDWTVLHEVPVDDDIATTELSGRHAGVTNLGELLHYMEGESDNIRVTCGFLTTAPGSELTAPSASIADEDQPILANGVQARPGWYVAVTAPMVEGDDGYDWMYYVYPGADVEGAYHGQWLLSAAVPNPLVPHSTNALCGTSQFECIDPDNPGAAGWSARFWPDGATAGVPTGGPGATIPDIDYPGHPGLAHVGQWRYTPPPVMLIADNPGVIWPDSDSVGVDGCCAVVTSNGIRWYKAGGTWINPD